jgi:hypothetical protein
MLDSVDEEPSMTNGAKVAGVEQEDRINDVKWRRGLLSHEGFFCPLLTFVGETKHGHEGGLWIIMKL